MTRKNHSPNRKPSLEEVAREHHAMIKRIASGYENDRGLLEDLVQNIYVSIWRALPAFRGESSLRTFVARIAINRSVTHVIRSSKAPRGSELPDDLSSPSPLPESQVIERERCEALVAAVRALPLAYRQTTLLVLEGLTVPEVAATLGLTANAVHVRMTRAREMLKQLLGDLR